MLATIAARMLIQIHACTWGRGGFTHAAAVLACHVVLGLQTQDGDGQVDGCRVTIRSLNLAASKQPSFSGGLAAHDGGRRQTKTIVYLAGAKSFSRRPGMIPIDESNAGGRNAAAAWTRRDIGVAREPRALFDPVAESRPIQAPRTLQQTTGRLMAEPSRERSHGHLRAFGRPAALLPRSHLLAVISSRCPPLTR